MNSADGSTESGITVRPSGLPHYDDLPRATNGGRSGWGLFGSDDSIGLLNLQTAEERRSGRSGLVRKGAVLAAQRSPRRGRPRHSTPTGGVPRHRLLHKPEPGLKDLDDVYDNFYPQASSQWDSAGPHRLRTRCFL